MGVTRALALTALLAFSTRETRFSRWQRHVVLAAFAVWTAFLAVPLVRGMASNLAVPREWDFLCFWLWGRMAVRGADFYQPLEGIPLPVDLTTSQEFSRTILHTGFWYPPPTMLLFAPLGLMSVRHAMLLWYAVQGAFAVWSAFLLYQTFFADRGLLGMVSASAMLAFLPPTASTIWFTQTNFMLLALFLLVLRERDKARAGIWVALGAIVKPYFLLLIGWFLVKKHGKAVAFAAGTLLLSALLVSSIFGPSVWVSFFGSSPPAQVPSFVYAEPMNQSLLGTLLRAAGGTGHASPALDPMYLTIAALLIGLTFALVARADKNDEACSLCLTLTASLLVYPATLAHYSLLLVVPLLVLRRNETNGRFGSAFPLAVILTTYTILSSDRFERMNFWANLLVWAAVAVACWDARLQGFRIPRRSQAQLP